MGFEAKAIEQWKRIPGDHAKGTLVKQDDWYKILGEPPKEPITIAGFKGGWGEAWIDAVIDSMKKDFPNIQISKDFDPRIWEKMKPRLVAGEVPDWNYYVLGPWGGEWQKAVKERVVVPADFLFDLEGYELAGQRVGDVISPGAAESANAGLSDAQWSLPLSQSVYGIYYNAKLFEDNKWPHPADISWEELIKLCDTIKASGVAPWTYAGQYPSYFSMVADALIYKKGGDKLLCDMDNLVEGAFTNPDTLWAIEQVQTLFKNGYIYPGSEALSHTESQQVFVEGKAAMIPNGSWMPNEQRETTPPDFHMKFSAVPSPKDGKGDPKALQFDQGASELQIGNGKNPLWGMEIMRRIYSPIVQRIFAETIGSPNAMKNVLKDVKTSPEWDSAAAAIQNSNGKNIIMRYGKWYPEMGKRYNESLGDLWSGKLSAKDGRMLLERGAKDARDDAKVTKQTRQC